MRTTLFALLQDAAGLSNPEAGAFLRVSPRTVGYWRTGHPKRTVKEGALRELSDLIAWQIDRADQIVECIEERIEAAGLDPADGAIDLPLFTDDHEAQGEGYALAAIHARIIALAAAELTADGFTVRLVPRAATPATALVAELRAIVEDGSPG